MGSRFLEVTAISRVASQHIAVEALARSPHVMRAVKDSNTAWLNGKAHLNTYESKRGTVGMRSVAGGVPTTPTIPVPFSNTLLMQTQRLSGVRGNCARRRRGLREKGPSISTGLPRRIW